MNKKSKSKPKKKTNTRKKIKQVGCSLNKKRLTQSGGDAYNVMPASKIYPLEDYSVDVQRASIDAGALPMEIKQSGGSQIGINKQSKGKRTFRKYYKKTLKGGDRSYFEYGKSTDYTTFNKLYSNSNPFYV